VRAPKRAKAAAAAPAELSEADGPLFDELKAWRLRVADGKPAFTIAHNTTLAAIAAGRPADEASLLAIRGIGPSFIAKFAPPVRALIAAHRRADALEPAA
jgi:superfamily II DNA helicase RecQ